MFLNFCVSAFNFQPKPRHSNRRRLRDPASVQGSDPRAGSANQRDHAGKHLPAAGASVGEAAGGGNGFQRAGLAGSERSFEVIVDSGRLPPFATYDSGLIIIIR